MPYTIAAPAPGVFYRRPEPDAPPFCTEGTELSEGDTVALIEVMKSFIEVKAEQSGKLVRFLVDNEDLIQAGQPLAEVA